MSLILYMWSHLCVVKLCSKPFVIHFYEQSQPLKLFRWDLPCTRACGIDAQSVIIRKARKLYTIMSAQLCAECSVFCFRHIITQKRVISVLAKVVVSPISIRAMMNNTAHITYIRLPT